MGCKLGMPSMKLSNTAKPSKHSGSFGGVSREGLEEREGRDIDINPEKTHLNVYEGFRTAAELIKYSDDHVKELKDAKGRAIRKDAVRMCATIFKPPAVFVNKIRREQGDEGVERFLFDCLEKFKKIVGEDNVKSVVIHKDELNDHMHVFWEPMTKDGRLCAKEQHNLKFFARMNKEMPAFLRERGWEIDDCECYDCAEENYQNEMERAKREEEKYKKQHSHGRSSASYKAEAEAEKQQLIEENIFLKTQIEDKEKEIEEKEKQIQAIENEKEKAQKELEAVQRTFATTLQNKEEYDNEIAKIENNHNGFLQLILDVFDEMRANFSAPDSVWQQSVNRFILVVEAFENKIKNLLGFEKLHDLSEEEAHAENYQNSIDDIINQAKVDAAEHGRKIEFDYDEEITL